jgi:excisionase family DNA binding protein
MNQFLTPKQVAQIFGVSLCTIYRLMDKRKLPFLKIGTSIRLSKKDVEKFLADNYFNWGKQPNIKL